MFGLALSSTLQLTTASAGADDSDSGGASHPTKLLMLQNTSEETTANTVLQHELPRPQGLACPQESCASIHQTHPKLRLPQKTLLRFQDDGVQRY